MTTLALLVIISAALLAQILAAIIFASLRRKPPTVVTIPARSVPNAAWTGLRAVRVRSRDDEDDAISQTSFSLEGREGREGGGDD